MIFVYMWNDQIADLKQSNLTLKKAFNFFSSVVVK